MINHPAVTVARASSAKARTGRASGAQSVERALTLLMQIARDDVGGSRLIDLAARSGLDPSTAHRLLSSLIRYGFVEKDASARRYFLGLEFFTAAAAASNRLGVADTVRDALLNLRDETGGTTMFLMRSGGDLVCVDLQFGAHETSVNPLDLGSRWPIGAGAAGVAVLAALPDAEAEDIAVRNARRFAGDPEEAVKSIRRGLIDARQRGYSIEKEGAGLVTFAQAVIGPTGRPDGALALNAPDREGGVEAGRMASALARCAANVERLLSGPYPHALSA